jgi:hypothetical protein
MRILLLQKSIIQFTFPIKRLILHLDIQTRTTPTSEPSIEIRESSIQHTDIWVIQLWIRVYMTIVVSQVPRPGISTPRIYILGARWIENSQWSTINVVSKSTPSNALSENNICSRLVVVHTFTAPLTCPPAYSYGYRQSIILTFVSGVIKLPSNIFASYPINTPTIPYDS